MSGIAGILKSPTSVVTEEELTPLLAAIAHRGPDDRSSFTDGNVGLSHCFLKIPSTVSVPQPLKNEDGNLTLVCDGRVFNHAELRLLLESRGHRFSTSSDCEVLLHLYEDEGEKFLDRVNGMYGLALWDARNRRLILARDRIGIKPLYYSHGASGLLFASEIKGILADPRTKRQVNSRGMADFFGISYIFDSETMFEDIMAVPPGSMYVLDGSVEGGKGRIEHYWDMYFEPNHPWDEDELKQRGLAILEEAVALESEGVTPLGIHLSGGIDSSFLTSLAARTDRENIIALTAGFREKTYDERDFANESAVNANVRQETIEVFPTVETFMDTMLKAIWHVDEPTVSPGLHSYFILNEFTARFVKVVLGGQGSNELLAGYNRYILADIREKFAGSLKHLNPAGAWKQASATMGFFGRNTIKGLLGSIMQPSGEKSLRIVSTFKPSEKAKLFSGKLKADLGGYSTDQRYLTGFATAPASTIIDRMQYLDMKNMMPNMLRILDRTCSAFAVEARTPYLDHHFVEFAASLSDDAVLQGTESKYILKKMGEGILRHDTIYRDKSGFAAPASPWLQGHLRETARDIIFSDQARSRGLFDEAYLKTVVDRHEKTGKGVWQVWMLLIFELWNRSFIDG